MSAMTFSVGERVEALVGCYEKGNYHGATIEKFVTFKNGKQTELQDYDGIALIVVKLDHAVTSDDGTVTFDSLALGQESIRKTSEENL
jgi:hypothetical protein